MFLLLYMFETIFWAQQIRGTRKIEGGHWPRGHGPDVRHFIFFHRTFLHRDFLQLPQFLHEPIANLLCAVCETRAFLTDCYSFLFVLHAQERNSLSNKCERQEEVIKNLERQAKAAASRRSKSPFEVPHPQPAFIGRGTL